MNFASPASLGVGDPIGHRPHTWGAEAGTRAEYWSGGLHGWAVRFRASRRG
jgi:hypothetical protein